MLTVLLLALAGPSADFPGPTPIGDISRWILSSDYPEAAIRAENTGTVDIEVSIDTTGHAARCRIVAPSGTDILDKMACAAFARRGVWEPTLDASGKPIFAIFRRRINWRLPGDSIKPSPGIPPDMQIEVAKLPVPAADATVVVRQIQRADGSQESCDVVKPSSSAALNRAACTVGAQLTATEPIGDAAGQLVRGARWRTIEFVEKGATPTSK